MRYIFAILILLIARSSSGEICRTNDEGPVKNDPCIFPFILHGNTYESCTNITDPDGKLWCATKVDENGSLVRGSWGYCNLQGLMVNQFK